MAFLRRLGYYLIGLSIGIVFLAFFLKNKTQGTGLEFCYLPNCRVLKKLRSKPLSYSDGIRKMMAGGQLDSAGIAHFLHDGEVDFDASDTHAEPCKYYEIQATLKKAPRVLHVTLCPEETKIEALQ